MSGHFSCPRLKKTQRRSDFIVNKPAAAPPLFLRMVSRPALCFKKRSTLVPPNIQLTFVLSVSMGFTVGDIH
ncbi:hypothetical protein PDIG_87800 [Penicillium digitatum PHI26]|uniref:Uncharacterized protein n=2 Tax=Penicillium digitatum TaxID=36651 RepID=K9F5Q8_PEND2|nr:hypothetical protein PDIP_33820 [Penicillium digitatum Pd1]EKV04695.1 hypothetical protein PDIG_87800 [Penicillium digitatum PHI26]EKV16794.1 hypothetical protein PDIP_33820 [Penicillium digitatum Pd1]